MFRGRLSMACQPTEAGIVRSGYCAVRASVPTGLMLHGYEGITMRIMTDGRECVRYRGGRELTGVELGAERVMRIAVMCVSRYRMNAQMDSWNPLNLYMVRDATLRCRSRELCCDSVVCGVVTRRASSARRRTSGSTSRCVYRLHLVDRHRHDRLRAGAVYR